MYYTLIILAMLNFLSSTSSKELPTAEIVDIHRYAGHWYEIARLPNSFQKGLDCVTATYRTTICSGWNPFPEISLDTVKKQSN